MKKIIPYCLLFVFVCLSQCRQKSEWQPLWTVEKLSMIESVLYDSKRDRLYVTCIEGKPLEKDGKGSVRILSLDGKIIDDQWINGLNAPTGMALVGDTLLVADIDRLVSVDLNQEKDPSDEKKKIWTEIPVPGSKFLNDIASSGDTAYISDMLGQSIYQYKDGNVNQWINDARLDSPNGLIVEGDHLVVASFGPIAEMAKTKVGGTLKTISLADKTIKSIGDSKDIGSLDGLASDGNGDYFVTDWTLGDLLKIKADGTFKKLQHFNPYGSADIAYIPEKKLLLVPVMIADNLQAFEIH